MTLRVAIYARYSSDRQSDRSIEDQVRICEARIAQEGWQAVALTRMQPSAARVPHARAINP